MELAVVGEVEPMQRGVTTNRDEQALGRVVVPRPDNGVGRKRADLHRRDLDRPSGCDGVAETRIEQTFVVIALAQLPTARAVAASDAQPFLAGSFGAVVI